MEDKKIKESKLRKLEYSIKYLKEEKERIEELLEASEREKEALQRELKLL